MTVRKLDHAGREVTAYPGRVLVRTRASVVLATRWERPQMDLGYVVLEPGDRWVETFYASRWYNVLRIHAGDGRLKGWYCNITRPARIGATEVIAEELGTECDERICVLSGPNLSREIAAGLPAGTVIAAEEASVAEFAQRVIMTPLFRVYAHDDVIGVELG